MLRYLKWIAGALGILLVFGILVGFMLPTRVHVTRDTLIAAPPAKVYPLIADFKNGWTRWNSFDDKDPGIQYSYEGPDLGVGAVQHWKSPKMGDGKMTLVSADSAAGVGFAL